MSQKTNWAAEIIFWFQIVNSWIFGISQAIRMWNTTQGVSVTWFLFWEVSLAISLYLGYQTYQSDKNRITFQTIIIYLNWVLMVGLGLLVLLWRGKGLWGSHEWFVSLLVASGVVFTMMVARLKQKTVKDPLVKGCLAVSFKSIPQLDLAYRVLVVGGAGLSPIMVINGHFTILTRIAQLAFSLRKTGKNPDTIGNLINEITNEATWVVMTICLIFFQRALS